MLFYRTYRRTGRAQTNLLERESFWKKSSILKNTTSDNLTVEQILVANTILPEVDTSREH